MLINVFNIMKVYIKRNNLQVELIRFTKKMLTLFIFHVYFCEPMHCRSTNANLDSGRQTVCIVTGDNGCRHLSMVAPGSGRQTVCIVTGDNGCRHLSVVAPGSGRQIVCIVTGDNGCRHLSMVAPGSGRQIVCIVTGDNECRHLDGRTWQWSSDSVYCHWRQWV